MASLHALPLFANAADEIGSRIRPRKSSRSPEPSRNRADSKTPGGDDDDAAAPEADAVLAIDRHKVRYTVYQCFIQRTKSCLSVEKRFTSITVVVHYQLSYSALTATVL
jgi:hypothetical protein